MRLASVRLAGLLVAALLCAACDGLTVTGSPASGRMSIPLPRFASQHAIGAQTDDDERYDPDRIHVRITVVGTGQIVFERDYNDADIKENDDENNPEVGTLDVTFPLPGNTAGVTFEVLLEAFNRQGELMYRVGPGQFQLGSGGRSGTVQVQAVYVGPGNDVATVRLDPRSLAMFVGDVANVVCTGLRPGGVETTDFPHQIGTVHQNVASANGRTVTANGPGTTQVVCRLEFGSRAEDRITVVVADRPGSITLVGGGAQTGPAGSQLAQPVRVQVRGTGGQPLAGVPVQVAVTIGGGSLNPNTLTTGADGTAEVQWTLGALVGSQSIQFVLPGTSQTLVVTANATQPPAGVLSGTVRNAVNSALISGATVQLRAGTATTGTPLATVVTSSNGAFSFPNLQAGTYTVRATASGFAEAIATGTVAAGATSTATLSMSPLLGAGQFRILVTWVDRNLDLDSRLTAPGGHLVYYGNAAFVEPQGGGTCMYEPPVHACLERDAVPPDFGDDPVESTRIAQLASGTYSFAVHNYTADNDLPFGTATSLSLSGARVEIFSGTSPVPIHTFNVPSGNGNLWTVFTISGPGGTVTPVNTISHTDIPPGGLRAGATAAKR